MKAVYNSSYFEADRAKLNKIKEVGFPQYLSEDNFDIYLSLCFFLQNLRKYLIW